uniref:Reverse transcriptase domain-containing protein n=1 Tax=Rhabditophanes sp. KR3021 TaxID=114890 RepID=A0AC35UFD7_9BILA
MDDLKAHSPTLEGLKLMTKVIEEGAAELGLELNKKKCGFYTRETEGNVVTAGANGNSETAGIEGDVETAETDGVEGDEFGDEFLPQIRKGYKYLGITQLEKDIPEENFARMTTKYIERTKKILQSVPCRKSCLHFGKVQTNRPRTNARMYLPEQIGGSAFRSLEVETCIQYIRRYVYLMAKTEVADAKKIFMAMHKGGCRSPISDFEHVRRLYKLKDLKLDKQININFKAVTRELIEEVKKEDARQKKADWGKSMSYPKMVLSLEQSISFPALKSINIDSAKVAICNASVEEQIFFNGKKASVGMKGDGKCRFGCLADETNYHVTSICSRGALITRHDMVVWNILKACRNKFGTPVGGTPKALQVEQAVLDEDYSIRAGASMLMEKRIRSNKPDIVVIRKSPKLAIVLEVSIPALKNYNLQKDIKITKYTKNSVVDISDKNVRTVGRDLNFCQILAAKQHCGVMFCPVIIGTDLNIIYS